MIMQRKNNFKLFKKISNNLNKFMNHNSKFYHKNNSKNKNYRKKFK